MSRAVLLLPTLLLFFLSCTKASTVPEVRQTAPLQDVTARSETSSRQTEWEKALGKAKKEGKLVIYASSGIGQEARTQSIKVMKERFNIDAEILMMRGSELTNKLFAERKSGLYLADVYLGGASTVATQLLPAKVLDRLGPNLLLPEVLEEKSWYRSRLHYIDSGEKALSYLLFPQARMQRNTELVKEDEVQSWKDLLNPKWKDRIIINDPTVTGAGLTWFSQVGLRIMNLDYMRELARQNPVIIRDELLQVTWLAQSKYPLAAGAQNTLVQQFVRDGAPIKPIIPREGNFLSTGPGVVGVINNAPHSNTVKIFINWLLSREGQEIFSRAMGSQSAREDISVAFLNPLEVRQKGTAYFIETEEDFRAHDKDALIAKEIFGQPH